MRLKDIILKKANDFYYENGKWPNELHFGEDWQDEYEQIENEREIIAPSKPDIYGKKEYRWFMRMRV